MNDGKYQHHIGLANNIMVGIFSNYIYVVYRFYKNDSHLAEMPKSVKKISQWLRNLTLIMLIILLLSPIIKRTATHIKKPLIAIAIDCSESMKLSQNFKSDSTKIK